MRKIDSDYIINILKKKPCVLDVDWYRVIGFLFSHKVAGLFYCKAVQNGVALPKKVESILREKFLWQQRKVEFLREYCKEISRALLDLNVKHAFVKGAVLSNLSIKERVYIDGERVSNDIDIVAKLPDIDLVARALLELGYVQGYYDYSTGRIIEFNRLEKIKRRMNRGELAPFVKLSGNKEFPFVEIDVNFSLGNTPSEHKLLLEHLVDSAFVYEGDFSISVLDKEEFFIHLLMHQYKESSLYFMVERTRDLDLYKLADIYYLCLKGLIDLDRVFETAESFDIKNEVGVVLKQVGEIFQDKELIKQSKRYGKGRVEIKDYISKKIYCYDCNWNKRIRCFSGSELLRGV